MYQFLITILQWGFMASACIQILYWELVFSRLAFYRRPVEPKEQASDGDKINTEIPVSVIVCARNEALNLQNNLPLILNQNYPNFEIIVVNDDSTDNTQEVLAQFSDRYKNFRTIHLTEKKGLGKKRALANGIENAKHEWLLLTDADCRPASEDWIRLMMSERTQETEIVLGYGPYEKHPGLLNVFIRYETVWTAIQYLSFALIGQPYMGVGRNLAYKKELYYRAGGFRKHEKIASGDDDLFISAVANRKNTKIALDSRSFVYSMPQKTVPKYILQKRRHLTTGSKYRPKHVFLLGILSGSHFFSYIFGFSLLALKVSTLFVCTVFMVRMVGVLLVYGMIVKKFRERDLLKWIPLLDFAHVFYYLLLTPTLMNSTRKWN